MTSLFTTVGLADPNMAAAVKEKEGRAWVPKVGPGLVYGVLPFGRKVGFGYVEAYYSARATSLVLILQ